MSRNVAVVAMIALGCAAAPALAASDYLLQLPPAKGEASPPVAIDSWSFGVCNSGQCTTGQSAAKGTPTKGSWNLATGKGGRMAAAASQPVLGDVDGDGRPDLAFTSSQDAIYGLEFTVSGGAPGIAAACASGHLDAATISNSADSFVVSSASVVCSKPSGAAAASYARAGINRIDSTPARISTNLTVGRSASGSACAGGTCDALTDGLILMRFADGQMKHTKTGHVTLLK